MGEDVRLKKNKTTKLIYNESTKLIEVKPDTESNFQVFLEKKKIYFETIMMLILSIAGTIISIVSVKVAMVANDISLNEQRIEDLEKQPSFVLDMESDEKNSYTIRNVGGDIKFGNVIGEEVLIIAIYDEQYDYIGKGYILLDGFFEKDYSTYNFETNCFELYRTPDPKPVVNWMDKIENLIVEQGLFCGIECTEYFDFMYTDYKQELIQKSMVAQGEYIKDIENTDVYTFKMRVNIDDLENEQLFTEIEEQLEEFRIYKEGKN
mgnify:FL=1